MTRDQVNQLRLRLLKEEGPDLRAECTELLEERAALLEGAKFLLDHHPTPLQKRWVFQLEKAVKSAEAEWKRPDVDPLHGR